MISWESILSVFNTKGTLLEWLQKLEAALGDGVLQSVTVNTVSEGVITLTFNFADGTTITTPQIDIPQGAQGPQGETGPQGEPVTNGTDGESFNPMGEWVTDNEYHPFDYVTYAGGSYLCTATIIDGTDAPPLDTAHWQLVAEKGDPGEAPVGTVTQSTVIERPESLPTATADSPDFVQTPDGTLYRKKATEGGSLLGTWVFNDELSAEENVDFLFSFTSDNILYKGIHIDHSFQGNEVYYVNENDEYTMVYDARDTWYGTAKKTIQITDISALTNEAEFTSWLTANATKQGGGGGGGATVTYSYVALADA